MYITFYGAVREVTGSMHLLTTKRDKILVDCGMFQGRRKDADLKNRTVPFDPKILSNIVLTHAHIDHSGRIPLFVKKDFRGRIVCTRPTMDTCEYLLKDSAHIQESDAAYLNYKSIRGFLHDLKQGGRKKKISNREKTIIKNLLKKNKNEIDTEEIQRLQTRYKLEKISPLYSMNDAESALDFFESYPYNNPVTVGNNLTCTFYDAGHILGSSFVVLRYESNGQKKTVCFTGDVGRFDMPILRDPSMNFAAEDGDIDLLVIESTYGDRFHDPPSELHEQLKDIIIRTYERKGSIIIPSFAMGRTQELIYILHELYDQGDTPKLPIYVNSPLAVNLTKVFGEHPECYDQETHHDFLEKGENPFRFQHLNYVKTLEDSMKLMREDTPHIVISSSGMCEAGRILHHLRHKIHNTNNTILIVGFMAQHTLGRRILELGTNKSPHGNAPLVKILGKQYPLMAEVVQLGGFSAHADRNELTKFITESNLNIKQIALVHGDEDQTLKFEEHLKGLGQNVFVPHMGESIMV